MRGRTRWYEIVGHEESAFEFRNRTTKEIPSANTAPPHGLTELGRPGVSPVHQIGGVNGGHELTSTLGDLGLVLGLGVMRWRVDSVVVSMGRGDDLGAD